jgi:hypothetical protein
MPHLGAECLRGQSLQNKYDYQQAGAQGVRSRKGLWLADIRMKAGVLRLVLVLLALGWNPMLAQSVGLCVDTHHEQVRSVNMSDNE